MGRIRTRVVGVEDRLPSPGLGVVSSRRPSLLDDTVTSHRAGICTQVSGIMERTPRVELGSDVVGNDISHHEHPHKACAVNVTAHTTGRIGPVTPTADDRGALAIKGEP